MARETKFAKTVALEIAYEESGSPDGYPLLLLHGFPYDVRQYDPLMEHLESLGVRVIVPYLRGYGPTRYLSPEIFRSGQQSALGKDVIDLLDALGIDRAVLVGYDWGGRGACVASALWPDRVSGLVSIGGYNIQNIAKSAVSPQSAEQEHQLWYQWYFHTERGRIGLTQNRDEICHLLWKMWSPGWKFTEETFRTTARSFENPDFVDTVIQSYRHRYGNAPGDPHLEPLEERLASQPRIIVPTVVLHGEQDRVEPPSKSEGQESQFTSHYERRLLSEAGHCAPAEAPREVGRAIRGILGIINERK